MNTSSNITDHRNRRRGPQGTGRLRALRSAITGILLTCLMGTMTMPMTASAAETELSQEMTESGDSAANKETTGPEAGAIADRVEETAALEETSAQAAEAVSSEREMPSAESVQEGDAATSEETVSSGEMEQADENSDIVMEVPGTEEEQVDAAPEDIEKVEETADSVSDMAIITQEELEQAEEMLETAAEDVMLMAAASDEKIYTVDPFDEAYSAGYFCITDSVGHGMTYDTNGWGGQTYWKGTNTKRRNDVYVDHHNGACINGTYYDIREYPWMTDNNYYGITDVGSNTGDGGEDAQIHREFHFYKAGTLDSGNPVEVTFRGVMRFIDVDLNEGYSFDQGLVDVWLSRPTNIARIDEKTWKGTWDNNNDGVNIERETIWAEVEGTPERPLTLTYWNWHKHTSDINYYGRSISYELVTNDKNVLPEDARPSVGTHCAAYARYSLLPGDEITDYTFSGWYYDKALTSRVPATITVTEDQTFYGTYYRSAGRITTEVVHGTITESRDHVAYGTNMTVTYAPEEGYFLDSVTVDGKAVTAADYPDAYEFTNIQEDHWIRVVYVCAKAPVKTVTDEQGTDMDGALVLAGEVLTYTITAENPADRAVQVVITDKIPANTDYVSSTPKVTPENGTLTWHATLEAGETGSFAFCVRVSDSARGLEVRNQAQMEMEGLRYETEEVANTVLTEPVKKVLQGTANVEGQYIADGGEVTYTILVTNPAEDAMDLVVTDTVSEYLEILGADHDGEITGQTIIWTLEDVPAGSSETVSFTAATIGGTWERIVDNTASMTLDGRTLESNKTRILIPVKPVVTVRDEVIRNRTEINETVYNEKVNNKTENNKTINNKTENHKTVSNKTVNNLTENNTVVNNTTENDVAATPALAMVSSTPAAAEAAMADERNVSENAGPATGDDSRMMLYLAAAGLAAVALAGWMIYRRRMY